MMKPSSSFSLRPVCVALIFLAALFSFVAFLPARNRVKAARVVQSDLVVSKTGDETAPLGGQITYSLSVYNAGAEDAINVVLHDPIPEHTTYVSSSSSVGTIDFDGTEMTWHVGTLPFDTSAGATLVVSVSEDTPRGTNISNTALGTAQSADSDLTNNSATWATVVTGPFAGDVLISEFRLRGPGSSVLIGEPAGVTGVNAGKLSVQKVKQPAVGAPAANPPDLSPQANDEFVEIYNNTDTPIAINAIDRSDGWALAASDGVVRFVIPNGTIIPARGHFLGINTLGYSLGGYPAGNDGSNPTTANGDTVLVGGSLQAGYSLDIPDNVGIALFRTSNTENFSTATRLDAAGPTSETNALYKEGNGYPTLAPPDLLQNLEHSFFRDPCGKGGSSSEFGPCPTGGLPKDTDNNATDFLFADVNATLTTAGQRLGAPGPENLTSPPQQNAGATVLLLDQTVGGSASPNRVRDLTPDIVNNSDLGTLDLRRRIVNSTGLPVTRLRFRVVDISTFPAPTGIADLRARTSPNIDVNNINDQDTCRGGGTPCTVTVTGTTLEQPPVQPKGGGLNSSLSSSTVTLATPLAAGDFINVRFLLGVKQTGRFKFFVNVELLTGPSAEGGDGDQSPPGSPKALNKPAPPAALSTSSTPRVFIWRTLPALSGDKPRKRKAVSKKRVKKESNSAAKADQREN